MRLYHTAGPNEVMIITGGPSRTVTEPDGTRRQVGYRMKVGGGALVIPWLESVSILPLDVFNVELKVERVYTANNVVISVEGQAQVKVRGDEPAIRLAAEHFLGRGGDAIRMVASEVVEGHMRAALGTKTVEEIIGSQEGMAGQVIEAAGKDLGRMGLVVLSFSFKEIADEQGFITALAEPRIAEVKRDAVIAKAEAEKDAMVKTSLMKQEGDIIKLRTEEEVLDATAQFEIKRASQQCGVNEQRARADVTYDLEKYKLSQELKRQEAEVQLVEKRMAIEVQEQEIMRRTKELDAGIKRPAEAHAYQARLEAELEAYRKELEGKGQAAWIKAKGQAEAETIRACGQAEAEAMASRADSYQRYNQAALAEMFVKVLPELARAVSEPLSKVEKIVMIGDGDSNNISKLT
ncbi:MAG: flotillin, partial [Deltaproteobacteria bacterium]|nr:flotillin [Deltaproteobacteria bacterium]